MCQESPGLAPPTPQSLPEVRADFFTGRGRTMKKGIGKIPNSPDSCAEQGRIRNLTVRHRRRQMGPIRSSRPQLHTTRVNLDKSLNCYNFIFSSEKWAACHPTRLSQAAETARALHSTPGHREVQGAQPLHAWLLPAGGARSQPLAQAPAASVSRGAETATLRCYHHKQAPSGSNVPAPPGARPAPGPAPDTCKATDGPGEKGAHAPVPALRPSRVPQPAPRSTLAGQLAPGHPQLPALRLCACCSGAPW